ncbi:MAG: LPP20 family lipoprotein [Bacteroidales bacterium]|nr:LPP20 family lipoprotein [Bacteroidales bacterium]
MNKFYIFFLIVLLASCAAKKKAAEFAMQPEWIKQKPIIPGYYVGVGSTKKVGTSAQYIASARKDALADLAAEVSVQVSSTSVLHTIETQYGHSETFSQRIETSTSDYLEGFEPVESYENEDSYWVYFRVSKETYQEMKAKKKMEALAAAMAKFESGLSAEQTNKPVEALTFYLQGLQAIKGYMQEETAMERNGKLLDIGNELFSSFNRILTGLAIVAATSQIEVKRGEKDTPELNFSLLFNDSPVQGVPVEFKYSGGFFRQGRQISDQEGLVHLQPGVIYSRNKKETIEAVIDLKDIAQKAVDDLFIRGLLAKRSIDPATVTVVIVQPALSVNILNDCGDFNCDQIRKDFSEISFREGYDIQPAEKADYIFSLNFSTKPGESAGGLTSVYLDADLIMKDAHNKNLWVKKINQIKGIGKNLQEAGSNAFDELVSSLDRIYFKQGMEQLK